MALHNDCGDIIDIITLFNNTKLSIVIPNDLLIKIIKIICFMFLNLFLFFYYFFCILILIQTKFYNVVFRKEINWKGLLINKYHFTFVSIINFLVNNEQ